MALLVDHDGTARHRLGQWLEELGCRCLHADSAQQAMQRLADHPVDVVLLDLMLPASSGHGLIRRLNRSGLNLPIVAMSSSSDVQDAIRSFRENAADYLRIPFTFEELTLALERAADRGAHAGPRIVPSPKGRPMKDCLRGMERRIQTSSIKLVPLDPAIGNLYRLLEVDEAPLSQVADIVERDPVLAASVLRAANSAANARCVATRTIKDACIRLGSKAIVALTFEVVVKSRFTSPREPYRSLLRRLWANAWVTSRIARALATDLRKPNVEQIQVDALLHNLGELACLHALEAHLPNPDTSQLVQMGIAIHAAHEQAGRALARAWGLPQEIVSLAGNHHGCSAGSYDDACSTRDIVMASWGCAIAAGHDYLPGSLPPVDPSHLSRLGLTDEHMLSLYGRLTAYEVQPAVV